MIVSNSSVSDRVFFSGDPLDVIDRLVSYDEFQIMHVLLNVVDKNYVGFFMSKLALNNDRPQFVLDVLRQAIILDDDLIVKDLIYSQHCNNIYDFEKKGLLEICFKHKRDKIVQLFDKFHFLECLPERYQKSLMSLSIDLGYRLGFKVCLKYDVNQLSEKDRWSLFLNDSVDLFRILYDQLKSQSLLSSQLFLFHKMALSCHAKKIFLFLTSRPDDDSMHFHRLFGVLKTAACMPGQLELVLRRFDYCGQLKKCTAHNFDQLLFISKLKSEDNLFFLLGYYANGKVSFSEKALLTLFKVSLKEKNETLLLHLLQTVHISLIDYNQIFQKCMQYEQIQPIQALIEAGKMTFVDPQLINRLLVEKCHSLRSRDNSSQKFLENVIFSIDFTFLALSTIDSLFNVDEKWCHYLYQEIKKDQRFKSWFSSPINLSKQLLQQNLTGIFIYCHFQKVFNTLLGHLSDVFQHALDESKLQLMLFVIHIHETQQIITKNRDQYKQALELIIQQNNIGLLAAFYSSKFAKQHKNRVDFNLFLTLIKKYACFDIMKVVSGDLTRFGFPQTKIYKCLEFSFLLKNSDLIEHLVKNKKDLLNFRYANQLYQLFFNDADCIALMKQYKFYDHVSKDIINMCSDKLSGKNDVT